MKTNDRTIERRRRPRLRGLAAAIFAALLIPASMSRAREADSGPAAPTVTIVHGLSAGDMLKIRAAASPLGSTVGSVPNGSGVARFGCEEFKGYEWCRVRVLDDPSVAGWTPARYLRPARPNEVTDRWKTAAANSKEPDGLASGGDAPESEPMRHAVVASAEDAIKQAIPDTTEPLPPTMPGDETDGGEHVEIPTPTPAPRGEPETIARAGRPPATKPVEAREVKPDDAAESGVADKAGGQPEQVALAGPAPDLEARLGVEGEAPPADDPQTPSASASEIAIEGVYGLAFAARKAPLTGNIYSPSPLSAVAPPADDAAAEPGVSPGVAAPGIPLPEPRPGEDSAKLASAAYDDSQTGAVALADAPVSGGPAWVAAVAQPLPASAATPDYDAFGEIPCARYLGQPMTRCRANVTRSGRDAAEVTIAWPDGGARTISFRAGRPEKSDSRGEMRFTREAGLNMIRIGASERFEITDALAFGG